MKAAGSGERSLATVSLIVRERVNRFPWKVRTGERPRFARCVRRENEGTFGRADENQRAPGSKLPVID